MNFSTKFRLLRAKNGLTQADIADKLGITSRAVGAWENGRSKPRLDKMAEIAVLFNTTVADLMGEDATEAAISGTSHGPPAGLRAHGRAVRRGTSPTRSRSPPPSPTRTRAAS
ncbi:MAG: helix-turn-helix transcriptional regulator [Collinsella sp.]